ncbi:ArsR family transcriptional regulator, partial [Streptomyces sp. NPDC005167]
MIRLHLDAADLRRITLAPAPNALFETALSVRGLRTGTTAQGRARPAVDQWRRRVNGSLAERAGVLLDLVPRDGYLPDFLLQPSAGDFATAVDLAARTPSELLVKDLRIADSPGHDGGPVAPSQWSRELAAGSAAARHT